MKRSWMSFVAAAFSLALILPARADVLSTPEQAGPACEAARTRKGAWLDDPALQRCLNADAKVPALEAEVDNLKQQKTSLAAEVADLKTDSEATAVQLKAYEAKDFEQTERIAELEEDLGAWYHNPFIMAVLGGAAGVALATGVVVGLVAALN